jgi:hypothetical protein
MLAYYLRKAKCRGAIVPHEDTQISQFVENPTGPAGLQEHVASSWRQPVQQTSAEEQFLHIRGRPSKYMVRHVILGIAGCGGKRLGCPPAFN